jgi:hypothetical protein
MPSSEILVASNNKFALKDYLLAILTLEKEKIALSKAMYTIKTALLNSRGLARQNHNKISERNFEMENGILNIIMIGYAIWAYYSGWKLLTGRFEYLDRRAFPNLLVKAILSIAVGSVYGAIYFILIIIRMMIRFTS